MIEIGRDVEMDDARASETLVAVVIHKFGALLPRENEDHAEDAEQKAADAENDNK
jgi:hypothetical protein